MNSTAANINHSHKPVYFGNPKALNMGGTPSAAAPGQGNFSTDCARWIEQNVHIYQAIMGGTSGLSQQDQAQFMDWYRYAYQTAFGGGQVGSNWGDGVYSQGQTGPREKLPPGAKIGPNGNMVFNQGTGELTYTDGISNGIDVFSDQFTLNISVKAKVDIGKTTDTRIKPATEVYKVTIQDPASNPAETVLFLSPETQLTLNTLNGKGVTFQGGIEKSTVEGGAPRFTVGTYTGDAIGEDGMPSGEASMRGVEDKLIPGQYTYKPELEGETIDFLAKPGKNQTHIVFANANITTRPGDKADVTLDGATGDLTIKVTHDDGSADTYVIKKGYNANLNINKEYVTFSGQPPKDGKIPDGFKGRIEIPNLVGGAGAAGKPETGKGPEADAKVQAFVGAFQDPPITLDDVKQAGLLDEIAYGSNKPSEAMLQFIFNHDNASKSFAGKIELLGKRFASILGTLGYQAEAGKQIQNENDIFAIHLNNLTINGTTYNLLPNNLNDWTQGFRLSPVSIRTEE